MKDCKILSLTENASDDGVKLEDSIFIYYNDDMVMGFYVIIPNTKSGIKEGNEKWIN